MEPVHQRFRAMLADLSAWANQPMTAILVDGAPSDYPNRRDYARCVFYPSLRGRLSGRLAGRCEIQVAPRFWRTSRRRREALLRHELGHVADFLLGSAAVDALLGSLSKNPELRADRVAKAVWGDDLVYDRKADIQTLPTARQRSRARPSYLPTGLAEHNGVRHWWDDADTHNISEATKINGQRVVINFYQDVVDATDHWNVELLVGATRKAKQAMRRGRGWSAAWEGKSTGRSGLAPLIWALRQVDDFQRRNPEATVVVSGSDDKRSRAYAWLLRRGFQAGYYYGGAVLFRGPPR